MSKVLDFQHYRSHSSQDYQMLPLAVNTIYTVYSSDNPNRSVLILKNGTSVLVGGSKDEVLARLKPFQTDGSDPHQTAE